MQDDPRPGRIRPAEWIWVAGLSLLLLLLSSVPYLAGYRAQTPTLHFSGAVFDRSDVAVHLATLQSGARGEWRYRMRFSSEPQQGAYIKLGYLFLGQAAAPFLRLSPQGPVIVYHAARLLLGLAACAAVYALMSQLFQDLLARRLGFALATTGAGVGWLQLLAGWQPVTDISPMEFWLVDGYVFFSLLQFPHLIAVIALLVAMIAGYLDYLRSPCAWKVALIATAGVVAQAVSPYAPVLADVALAGAVLSVILQSRRIPRQQLGALLVIGAAQIPLLVYNLRVFSNDPLLRVFAQQNVTLSPPLIYVLFGYFLFWPLAAIGIWALLRKPQPGLVAMLSWLLAATVLAYLPWPLQRRFFLGYTIPLAALATLAVTQILLPRLRRSWPGLMRRWTGPLVLLFVGMAMLSSMYTALGFAVLIRSRPAEYFDPAELTRAVDWLSSKASPDDVVLGSSQTGMLVAARAGLVAYLGSPFETLYADRKMEQVEDYYAGRLPAAWILESGVDWVVRGPYESPDSGESPIGMEHLTLAFQQGEVQVFRVDR